MPTVPVSPKADNRPALRPAKEGEEEGSVEQGAEKAESLGWQFVNFEANGGEIYQSLLRDEKGAPTQMWSVQQHGGKYPTEHPEGWNAQMLYYNDGVPIKAEAVVGLLKQMPYANNFALAVQDIRDEQAQKDADAIPIPELVLPMSPGYTPSSPVYTSMYEPSSPMHYAQQQQPMVQAQQQIMQQQQQLMQQQQQMQPMVMMPQQPIVMMPQQQMMVPQPMMMMQPTSPTSATGAKAAELIEEQLHPDTESAAASMLDVAPEVKPAESSSASSESSSSGSSDGKRVIKLS
jgi:hypothetical protein